MDMKPSSSVDNFIQKLNDSVKEHEQSKPVPSIAEIPPKILSAIWEENTDFLLEKFVLSTEYFSFVWDITNLYSKPSHGIHSLISINLC